MKLEIDKNKKESGYRVQRSNPPKQLMKSVIMTCALKIIEAIEILSYRNYWVVIPNLRLISRTTLSLPLLLWIINGTPNNLSSFFFIKITN